MKKYKEVVILPTHISELYLLHGKLNLSLHGSISQNDGDKEPQHLYITSDESVIENDYIYNEVHKSIVLVDCKANADLANATNYRWKVIATTNPLLTIDYDGKTPISENWNKSIPQIPQSFISLYIEEYNKERKITEVEVEYTRFVKGYFNSPNHSHVCSENWTSQGKKFYQCCGNIYWENDMRDLKINEFSFLKINPDNTISIKPIKESWTREEVEELLDNLWDNIMDNKYSKVNSKEYENWVKKNL